MTLYLSSSHPYPGCVGRLSNWPTVHALWDADVYFADGSLSRAACETLERDTFSARIDSYATLAGTRIAAKAWLLTCRSTGECRVIGRIGTKLAGRRAFR